MGLFDKAPIRSRTAKYVLIMVVVTLGIILAAVAAKEREAARTGAPGAAQPSAKPIVTVIRFVNGYWDSACINNEIARVIVEFGYQYKASLEGGKTDNAESMLIAGKADVVMEHWIYEDVLSNYSARVKNGTLLQVGINYNDTVQGVFVPEYVLNGEKDKKNDPATPQLVDLKDLKNFWNIFKIDPYEIKPKFYGCVKDWEDTNIKVQDKFQAYGLSSMFDLVTSKDEKELTDSIVSALEQRKPWVGYYWKPSWVFGKYKLVQLKEADYNSTVAKTTGQCAEQSIPVTIVAAPSLRQKAPDIYDFLSKYKTGSQLLSDLLAYRVENKLSFTETAQWFFKTKPDIWKQWVSPIAALRIEEYLKTIS